MDSPEPVPCNNLQDPNSASLEMEQLSLFGNPESSAGLLELFPAVWQATDALASPDVTVRCTGLEQLSLLEAARFSPLVVYVLASRLTEPSLALRAKVVELLAQVLKPAADGKAAPEAVRQTMGQALRQMRTRQIFALLEVAEHHPEGRDSVVSLLGECSYTGNHLVDILNNRSLPFWVRKMSIRLCGEVGFLATLPALERLAGRLEGRLNGQQSMPFLPKDAGNETELLPLLRQAIERLQAP